MDEHQNEAADLADSGYQASVNQARDEPVPASHHDDRRQEAVVRNEEHSHAQAGARPDGPGEPDGLGEPDGPGEPDGEART